jgi:hypothetical protein
MSLCRYSGTRPLHIMAMLRTGADNVSTTTHMAKYGNTHHRVCLYPVPRSMCFIPNNRLCR